MNIVNDFPSNFTALESEYTLCQVAQPCLTPRDPMDCSPPGSSVHGVLQARVLEWGAIVQARTLVWVAISFSNA